MNRKIISGIILLSGEPGFGRSAAECFYPVGLSTANHVQILPDRIKTLAPQAEYLFESPGWPFQPAGGRVFFYAAALLAMARSGVWFA